jgi:hypothetical protein
MMVVRELEPVTANPVPYDSCMALAGDRKVLGGPARESEPEIDYDRVIWDLDYRRRVVDELNRVHRPRADRREGHVAL